jgi:hypothetical protein
VTFKFFRSRKVKFWNKLLFDSYGPSVILCKYCISRIYNTYNVDCRYISEPDCRTLSYLLILIVQYTKTILSKAKRIYKLLDIFINDSPFFTHKEHEKCPRRKRKQNNLCKYFKETFFCYFVTYDHQAQLRIQKFNKILMKTTKFHAKLRNLRNICIIAHKIYVWIFATFVPVLAAYFFTTLGKTLLTNVKKNLSDQSTICIVPNCIVTITHV